MSRRRALLSAVLLASVAPVAALAQSTQTPAPGRPISAAPTYQDGQEVRPSYQPPAPSQRTQTGRRLEVPTMGGAASQSTSGGQSATGWQKPKKGREAEQEQEKLRRLDPDTLAGGQPNLAGGDYGVEPREPEPLAGGDYGVPTERPSPTVTIAPSVLGDPLAAAPRGFRTTRLPRLRKLPEPSALTGPGQVDPQDPFAPLGIRAGSFLIRPSIETAVGYDTNPDRKPKRPVVDPANPDDAQKGAKGSKYLRTRGDIDVQSDWERHELDFRGTAEVRKDLDIKQSGYEPQVNAALAGRVDVTERTQINAELRGNVSAARPGDPETPTGIKGEEITRQAGATLGVAQRFNRFSLRLDGLVDRFTVDNGKSNSVNEETGSDKIDNSDRAYTQYEVRLRGAYEISPKLAPFVEVAVDRRDYDKSRAAQDPGAVDPGQKLGSDGYAARAGAQFELGRLVTGEASLGYGRQTPNDARLKPVEGLLIDGALAWTPTALTTVRLNATSALQETSLQGIGAGGVLSRSYEVSIEHRLRRNWSLTAKAALERSDYQGASLKYNQKTLGLETEYRLNRGVAIIGSLERQWLDSTMKTDNYTATIVEVGLKFRR